MDHTDLSDNHLGATDPVATGLGAILLLWYNGGTDLYMVSMAVTLVLWHWFWCH